MIAFIKQKLTGNMVMLKLPKDVFSYVKVKICENILSPGCAQYPRVTK